MSLIVYFSRQSPELPGQYDDKFQRLSVYEGTGEARGIYVQILLEKGYNPKDISTINIAATSWFTEDDLHLVRRVMDGVPALVAKTILEGTTIDDVLKAIRVDLKIEDPIPPSPFTVSPNHEDVIWFSKQKQSK